MFKLGFSHVYRVKINLADFRIFFSKKNFFSIFGFENQNLKNLGYSLKSFRKASAYKYKGISFIKEVIKLKPGKKEQI
jgi:large subunit ribosomal protein L6